MGIASYIIKTGLKKFFLPKYLQKPVGDSMQARLDMMNEYTKTLTGQHNVSKVWIEHLIKAGKGDELKTIVKYLRSPAADSISPWDRALLIHQAMDKLGMLKEIANLLH